MAGVKREVELLLQEDLDDEEVYWSDRNDDDIHEDHGDDEAAIPIELDSLHDHKDEHTRRRMKRKVPPETVEWDANLATNTAEIMMMMRRKLTRRGLEKRQEKELK